MAIAIERHGIGYRVQVRDSLLRINCDVKTTAEIGKVVDHYYGAEHSHGSDPSCALCRLMQREESRRAHRAHTLTCQSP